MNNSFSKWLAFVTVSVILGGISDGKAEEKLEFMGNLFDRIQFSRAMQVARQKLMSSGHTNIDLEPRGLVKEEGVSSFRFQQFMNHVPVLGGITVVENGRQGDEGVVFETAIEKINTVPTLTAAKALEIASADTKLNLKATTATATLKVLPGETQGTARLIYWVDFPTSVNGEGGEMIVDAHSGAVLARMTKFRTLAPVDVYSAKGVGKSIKFNAIIDFFGRRMPKSCEVTDLASGEKRLMQLDECEMFLAFEVGSSLCQLVDALTGDPMMVNVAVCPQEIKNLKPAKDAPSESALRAAENSRKILEYYLSAHKRNSYDGNGAAAKSAVHVGIEHANASWNSELGLMAYGAGDGKMFGDFTTSLDVAGHEMTHGVISRTAKFISQGEPGALDEAYADFFGLMIVNNGSWVMGKDIFLDHSEKGIRDVADPGSIDHMFTTERGEPTRRPMPKHVNEKFDSFGQTCDGENDRCYVHGNSTIFSHALYQVHQRLGREKTEKMVYQGLTRYLSESSNFVAAKNATVKACAALYDSSTCKKVTEAFAVVGL